MEPQDIRQNLQWPHALALEDARTLALKAYGIDPHALMQMQHGQTELMECHSEDHALMIQSPHELVIA
jgi:hypothetical protein